MLNAIDHCQCDLVTHDEKVINTMVNTLLKLPHSVTCHLIPNSIQTPIPPQIWVSGTPGRRKLVSSISFHSAYLYIYIADEELYRKCFS